ncbi:MAG TPA: hypothetical protein VLH94_03920 [Spirochaetia bacterium]|nr:hypothetical protein [Spirochaetia bacterium]
MNRKFILYFFICALFFISLVSYNYLVAQKKIKETRPSPLGISLESYPEKVVTGQTGTFIWHIDGSSDLFTPKTTIYWGYTASPSALTQNDSPEAVGYPYHQEDYSHGIFSLPDFFDLDIMFNKNGKIYFRAYAKVGNNHLWTDEKTVDIISNTQNGHQ